jgi:hypothetical protein
LFCEFFKSFSLLSLLFILINATSACVSIEQNEKTADGQIIPGKQLLQFAEYEYVCEPTKGRSHTEMEQLLDRYGAKGWKLAGFMHKGGDTNAFCMLR